MRLYMKCSRCREEAEPSWKASLGVEKIYSRGEYALPMGWYEIDGARVVCPSCRLVVEDAINKAMQPPA